MVGKWWGNRGEMVGKIFCISDLGIEMMMD